jgi:hypothetical protein
MVFSFSKGEKWYDKLFNVKYLPLFHQFKAIYQFPKHTIFWVKIVANASLNNPWFFFLHVFCYAVCSVLLLFLLFGKVHIFENFLQFYQYLVIDDGNPSDCNSLIKSIRKTSKFSIYFIYITRHLKKKNILKSFLQGFSSNQHIVQKPLSEMYTSHFDHVWSSTFQQQTKKTNRFTALPNIFYKNFFIYIKLCHLQG